MSEITIDDRDGEVERVSTESVVREWARQELAEEDDSDVEDVSSHPPEDLVRTFGDKQALAESVFVEDDHEWYRLRLTEDELRRLYVVKGPEQEGWRAVAEDDRVEDVARRIHEADDVDALDEGVPKDVDDVAAMAEAFAPDDDTDPFVAVQESPDEPTYVVDGNHRAVAIALHVLAGGDYDEQSAYVGVPHVEDGADVAAEDDAESHPAY